MASNARSTVPRKSAAKSSAAKRPATNKAATKKAATRDPRGGLTTAGRAAFARSEGAHLRPGVKGAADTPEKMRRKGSFLRRHFANPRGPLVDDRGEPTRLALSAPAWGERLPKTAADARRLAAKGAKLLAQYHAAQERAAATRPATRSVAKRTAAKRGVAKRTRSTRTGG